MSYQYRPAKLEKIMTEFGWVYVRSGVYSLKIGELELAKVLKEGKDKWVIRPNLIFSGLSQYEFRTASDARKEVARSLPKEWRIYVAR